MFYRQMVKDCDHIWPGAAPKLLAKTPQEFVNGLGRIAITADVLYRQSNSHPMLHVT